MHFLQLLVLLSTFVGLSVSQISNFIPTVATTTEKSTGKSAGPALPHATYLSANSYVDNVPYGVAYNAQPQPQAPASYYPGYLTGMLPSARSTLEVVLWVFARVGTIVLGTAGLFLIGGLFNGFICGVTSLCTYDFHGFGALNTESVRSMITPEKISTAAALVQDAIGKYNRMQNANRN